MKKLIAGLLAGITAISFAGCKVADGIDSIANVVTSTYYKVEDFFVGSYEAVEDFFVGAYEAVENQFIEWFFLKEGETIEEAKDRLNPNK